MVDAAVRVLYLEEGWGVLDSPETPGGCWAGFASVEMDGYKTLAAGQQVRLHWGVGSQDGFDFRAVRVIPIG